MDRTKFESPVSPEPVFVVSEWPPESESTGPVGKITLSQAMSPRANAKTASRRAMFFMMLNVLLGLEVRKKR
jgi:hypothetical protein